MRPEPCLEVALTKDQCPFCAEVSDGALVMNSILTAGHAAKVKKLHGQVTGYKPCSRCQQALNDGAVFLVEVDPAKSTVVDGKLTQETAHRTGRLWGIKREAAERLLGEGLPDMVFIDPEAVVKIGLPSPE